MKTDVTKEWESSEGQGGSVAMFPLISTGWASAGLQCYLLEEGQ